MAAGSGPLEGELAGIPNLKNVGFQSGEALRKLIAGARFSVYPSEWYENCPFSVMESLMYGTPVLGADIGGIPELIDAGENGELFESGNADALAGKIRALWGDRARLDAYTKGLRQDPLRHRGGVCGKADAPVPRVIWRRRNQWQPRN